MRQGRLDEAGASLRRRRRAFGFACIALAAGCGPAPGYEATIERIPSSWTPPPDDLAIPFAMGQTWVGSYVCPQGETALALHIIDIDGGSVRALFDFNHRDSGAQGVFEMQGTWRIERRELDLAPGKWITRPEGYVTVGMRGFVSINGRRYMGVIPSEGCSTFALRLVPDPSEGRLP